MNNLTADKAAGAIVRGLSQEVGNELDEFVTESVRNQLLGLPLDLPAINLARGRSEGIPSLNEARRQFFAATKDAALKPYLHWQEFGNNLKHPESLINFIAVYGTHASYHLGTTLATKTHCRARTWCLTHDPFLKETAATSGLNNVDFWIGGMAERQAVFGGLLGSTFNFVFERQLEKLQDGDRFYSRGLRSRPSRLAPLEAKPNNPEMIRSDGTLRLIFGEGRRGAAAGPPAVAALHPIGDADPPGPGPGEAVPVAPDDLPYAMSTRISRDAAELDRDPAQAGRERPEHGSRRDPVARRHDPRAGHVRRTRPQTR